MRFLPFLTIIFAARVSLAADAPVVDFARDVRPLLVRHCERCHGTKNQEADLQLNRRSSVLGRLDSEEAIVIPGNAAESLLLHRLTDASVGDIMPLDGEPLSESEIEVLRAWINQGAPWPDDLAEPRHWAWESVQRPELPDDESDVAPIDQFVRRRLDQASLSPAKPLDRPRLIRRTSLALTGIPPTPEQVIAFVNDTSPDAFEQVVDRLLVSPRYGERWAVPWMDLARYADSNGFQADQLRDNWAWRDWVIRAFNSDMPFDEFVIDQLAGDLRPSATVDQKIATGFHRMTTCNVEAGVDPEANRVNQIVDRVNTTATVFLGVTLECAQCHDHKYDPFTQEDYYRFFAYFNNTPLEVKNTSRVTWDFFGPKMELPIDDDAASRLRELEGQLAELKKREADFTKNEDGQESSDARKTEQKSLTQQIAALQDEINRTQPTTLVMVEMEEPRVTHVLTRGDYEQPAERVDAGTPATLPSGSDEERTGDRMELARWLTSPENPLLARVTVNRWWHEFFGIGLVPTLEDFGTQSEPPSHPDLLDWLAAELMSNDWSMKHIHKQIVMSATWQQSAQCDPDVRAKDPHNRLLARGPRFRLSAETIRDNALAISGLLSTKMYGWPVMPYQPEGIWRSVGRNQPKWDAAQDEDRFRRGVYVVCKRAAPYPSFMTFDAPDRGACTVNRPRSNTPLQALTLLNDRAYAEMAMAFAGRVLRESPESSDAGRIRYAMQLAVARDASDFEVAVLRRLLHSERRLLSDNPVLLKSRLKNAPPGNNTKSPTQEQAAWFAVTNAVLNLDETVTP